MLRTATKMNSFQKYPFLKELGLSEELNSGVFHGKWCGSGPVLESLNPTTEEVIGRVSSATAEEYDLAVAEANKAAKIWRNIPAPKRGEVVRQVGEELRANLHNLGKLVSLEVGKIEAEGVGEVQEYVDICDYAVGLSRMFGGPAVPSERENFELIERWHPLGTVGIISAFNFPVAVYGWNAAIALVTGNALVWKGSPTTPLTSVATNRLMQRVMERNDLPPALCSLVTGGADIGQRMAEDRRIDCLSFTGSTKVGREVGVKVQERSGRSILELGGNNAAVVMADADMDIAMPGVIFAAIGTCGQRCTSTRRLFVQREAYDAFIKRLVKGYESARIGDPLDGALVGPLHNHAAVDNYLRAIEEAKQQGGKVLTGGKHTGKNFVEPTIIEIDPSAPVVQRETFAPILYTAPFDTLEQAIELNNMVESGLSSALFTTDMRNVGTWYSASGSDTGLCNVNTGSSGAEIGLCFGGSKSSGNGFSESGSQAWQGYMRRQSCSINNGRALPLAQGIKFE